MTIDIPAAVAERAATHYEVVGECHLSTYSTGSHTYAQIGWWVDGHNVMTTAHRAAWVHYTGEQPAGMVVDHIDHCDHRCVRREHLRLLTNEQNARRNRPGLDYPLEWTCSRNHGVERRADGKCPECIRVNQADYRQRRRAA